MEGGRGKSIYIKHTQEEGRLAAEREYRKKKHRKSRQEEWREAG